MKNLDIEQADSKEDLEKYAGTKHKDKPEHVKKK
jgi:hypothetical protein